MKKNYHVIIIGAGPSGLSTAINLKKMGEDDILVVDKSKFPRYKCCAGYITNKTSMSYYKLGVDIKKCHYSLIDDFNIFYKRMNVQKIKNKFLYTNSNINRTELDYELFKKAKENGIDILEKTMIKDKSIDDKFITLSNGIKVKYDYLVFADGTTSSGGELNPIKRKNIALQAIFEAPIEDGIDIHFGITKCGYAWVSSFNGKVNVGITDIYNKDVDYHKVLKDFIFSLGLSCNDSDIKGSFTPIGAVKPMINDNIFYVGDAVGACDPLTLSGLRYGIESGNECALAIFHQQNDIYKKYIKKLRFKFSIMKAIQFIFYLSIIQFLVFKIGCRIFKPVISFVFNHIFLNKK